MSPTVLFGLTHKIDVLSEGISVGLYYGPVYGGHCTVTI